MKLSWLTVNSSFSHSSLALPLVEQAAGGGAEWSHLVCTINDDVNSVCTKLVALQPDIITATCYLFTVEYVLRVLKRVKLLLPDTIIVLGGPEFLGNNEDFLRKNLEISAVFRGEGEVSFGDWLVRVDSMDDWEGIVGLCWLDRQGGYCDDGGVAYCRDEGDVPLASKSVFFDWSKKFVQLETSRGCFARCSYCTSGLQCPVFDFSISRIRGELLEIRRHNIFEVRILDRTFNFSDKRAAELLRMFRVEFSDIAFHLEMHPECLGTMVREELLRVNPRQLHLEVGLQTTNVDSLRLVQRSPDSGRALEGIKFLASCSGFDIHVDLLAGLPMQSLKHLLVDIHTLSNLGVAEIQLEVLKILPGTELVAQVGNHQIVAASMPPYEVLRSSSMSVFDLDIVRKLSRLLDHYYNHPALHAATRVAAKDSGFFMDFLNYLEQEDGLVYNLSLKRRFLLFHNYGNLKQPNLKSSLEYSWLRCGQSAAHGIGKATLWKSNIPDYAQLLEGDEKLINPKSCRIWYLKNITSEYWFVYDRSVKGHHAIAIYSANS